MRQVLLHRDFTGRWLVSPHGFSDYPGRASIEEWRSRRATICMRFLG
ncbi:hypothetical protein [Bradyrhizobium sp. ERR14]|nr:hypothetical protein [Bradyrhizobium sp. ERR14]MBB4398999.1 hypothetical protein [Bradyrhizobium sp. ERR14]